MKENKILEYHGIKCRFGLDVIHNLIIGEAKINNELYTFVSDSVKDCISEFKREVTKYIRGKENKVIWDNLESPTKMVYITGLCEICPYANIIGNTELKIWVDYDTEAIIKNFSYILSTEEIETIFKKAVDDYYKRWEK